MALRPRGRGQTYMNLLLALCVATCIAGPSKPLSAGDSPLIAPSGWKSETKDGSTTLTPADVPSGKLYAVVIHMLPAKADAKSYTLDEALALAKAEATTIGTFKSAIDPKTAKSDGGWDYKFDLGEIKGSDAGYVAQIMAIKKGDECGVVIVLADSVETMSRYADTFGAAVRSMGVTSTGNGNADLQYTVPPGWTETKVNGFPMLVKERKDDYNNYRVSLLILATEALSGSIRDQFVGYWKSYVSPSYDTKIAPIPLMARLKTGYACAYDGEWDAKAKNGGQQTIALYMIAHGGKAVPVLAICAGNEWSIDGKVETEVASFLDSARIPGASDKKVQLFDPSAVAGDWKESGTEFANYVTRSGDYVGDATISTASYLTLSSNGTYDRTLLAVGSAGNIREKNQGNWSIDDDDLVLSKAGRYSLLGSGSDPKVGRFLVIGNNRDQKVRLKFTNPRGPLQAMWMRAK